MNSDLVERVAEIIKANTRMVRGCEAKGDCPHCARDIKKAAAAVLAELAGELRDAELSRIYRAERDRQEAFAYNLLEALTSIHRLAAPPDVEVNGKIYAFKPDPTIYLDAWREMSKRIREIPKAIDEARHDRTTGEKA